MRALALAALLVVACGPSDADKRTVGVDERTLMPAAQGWIAKHPGCPTVDVLRTEKEISADSKTSDPWGTLYAIACEKGKVSVVSAGPDRKMGTGDDIRENER